MKNKGKEKRGKTKERRKGGKKGKQRKERKREKRENKGKQGKKEEMSEPISLTPFRPFEINRHQVGDTRPPSYLPSILEIVGSTGMQTTYFWIYIPGKTFELVQGSVFKSEKDVKTLLPEGTVLKMTSYMKKDEKNYCCGTVIARVTWKESSTQRIPFRTPNLKKQETIGEKTGFVLESRIAGMTLTDMSPGFFDLMTTQVRQRLPPNDPTLSGKWFISWQWPMTMPGWFGLRMLGRDLPGLWESLDVAEWHGAGIFGLSSLPTSERYWGHQDLATQLNVWSAAVGAYGYLIGYDHEKRDDTGATYCSLGTDKDCDDMATNVTMVIGSLLRTHKTHPLVQFAKEWFKHTYLVAGVARPEYEGATGETIGHMWCEVSLRKPLRGVFRADDVPLPIAPDGCQSFIVEATSSVAYFDSPWPITAQSTRQGHLREYLERFCYHSATGAYEMTNNGPRKFSVGNATLPSFVTDYCYPMPPLPPQWKAIDISHVRNKTITFFESGRKENMKRTSDTHTLVGDFVPFTTGGVIWQFGNQSKETKGKRVVGMV